jgi:exo-1,4-beta-D-glucosaminidase
MELRDPANKLVSSNFHWLSLKKEALEWEKTNFYVTPVPEHADLKALNSLPRVKVLATATATRQTGEEVLHLNLRNPSKTLAFGVQLKVKDASGKLVSPVLIEDNYFPLLPGERRSLTIRYSPDDSRSAAVVQVDGYNVEQTLVRLGTGAKTAH